MLWQIGKSLEDIRFREIRKTRGITDAKRSGDYSNE